MKLDFLMEHNLFQLCLVGPDGIWLIKIESFPNHLLPKLKYYYSCAIWHSVHPQRTEEQEPQTVHQ
jgi:hypothetical protein